MSERYLVNLASKQIPESVGNKARNLHRLHTRRFRIPPSWAIKWEAYHRFLQDDQSLHNQIKNELNILLNPHKNYAVRSSANVEDHLERSYAGQFKTVLNVQGVDALTEAIWSVWSAVHSEGLQSYLDKAGNSPETLNMGVIIQEMVKAQVSGVAFSRNPITALDEIVIEAVPGSGIALVQEGMTPSRWVSKWGRWLEPPDPEKTPAGLPQAIVDGTKRIARAFRADVDLEWAWDGEALYWLQMRDITSIRDMRIYTNRISKEMLPGMIKPLVWSVNVPMNTGEWVRILGEVVNLDQIEPESLVKSFYYRAYFDMGTFGQIFERLGMPRESLEMMMGLLPSGQDKPSFKMQAHMLKNFPRMTRFTYDKWTLGSRVEQIIERLRNSFKDFSYNEAALLDEASLLIRLDQLYEIEKEVTRYNIIIPLMMLMYNAVLKRRLEAIGVDFRSFDLTEGMQDLKFFDPGVNLEALHDLFSQLEPEMQNRILSSDYPTFLGITALDDFQHAFHDFLDRFGHLSDNSNDFSSVPWRENPEVVLNLIADYQRPEERTTGKVRLPDLALHGIQGLSFRIFYNRARQFRLYREQISSLHTYGLGLLRAYYLALGERLTKRGWIGTPEDIFYLYKSEISQAVLAGQGGNELHGMVVNRQQEIAEARDVQLPEIIFGDQPPPIIPSTLGRLRGTPTSPGYYTGTIKVVKGIADFAKLEPGDVLIIPYSDVGWTPLFAKAGAVVAESGGILSHSSIIAREYNIPAVVSVDGALNLPDLTLVTVDGFQGEIIVHGESYG